MNRLSVSMLHMLSTSTSRTIPRLAFSSVSSSCVRPAISSFCSFRSFSTESSASQAASPPSASASDSASRSPASAKRKGVISTSEAPAAIGPYSQARIAGSLVFVSGSLGLDPKTGKFPSDTDVAAQTKQSMDNIVAILKSADSSIEHVLKTTILLADINDFAKVNEIYAKYFTSGVYPARATYAVKALPKGALVEIEAIAARRYFPGKSTKKSKKTKTEDS